MQADPSLAELLLATGDHPLLSIKKVVVKYHISSTNYYFSSTNHPLLSIKKDTVWGFDPQVSFDTN